MAATGTIVDALDRVIDYFNRRKLDLPDGLFDRTTQFIINGAPFETLLSTAPHDPLILMLARGPAGYRFTMKALQHAVPDIRIERGEVDATAPDALATRLWLAGKLRGTSESIETIVDVRLKLNGAAQIEVAAATMNEAELTKIREARLRS